MSRVVAKENGHDGINYRAQGEVFEVPDEWLNKDGQPADGSTWYEAAGKDSKTTAPPPSNAMPPGAGPRPGTRAKG